MTINNILKRIDLSRMLLTDAYSCQYLLCNTVKSQMYMLAMQNYSAECAEVFAPLEHDSNIIAAIFKEC